MTTINRHTLRNFVLSLKDELSSFIDIIELACIEFHIQPEDMSDIIKKDRTLYTMIKQDCILRKMIVQKNYSKNINLLFKE